MTPAAVQNVNSLTTLIDETTKIDKKPKAVVTDVMKQAMFIDDIVLTTTDLLLLHLGASV